MTFLDYLNEHIIWGAPMLVLFIGAGVYFSVKLRFFQLSVVRILRSTIFASEKHVGTKDKLSPFQTLTSTLAVTLGTGNIAAIGTAIVFGGAGAIFWMWVSALLGMATAYAENYLGMRYRKGGTSHAGVHHAGVHHAGVYCYIERALGRGGAVFFALCCVFASLGMGNMTQINTFAKAAECIGTPTAVSGAIAAAITGTVILGGAMFFGKVTEKVIPVISAFYILGCLAVIAMNFTALPAVLARIISEAFGLRAVGGGALGAAISWGFRRGVFSNEAGLGSSVIMNSMTSEQDPHKQSLWATLAVFIDTIVVCSLTAFAILLTGADKTGAEGVTLANAAFRTAFADFADVFVTVSLCVFALSTVCGWSVFGAASLRYVFGERAAPVKIYLVIFTACCFIGAIADLELVWGAADVFNGLMAVPNLLSLFILRKEVEGD